MNILHKGYSVKMKQRISCVASCFKCSILFSYFTHFVVNSSVSDLEMDGDSVSVEIWIDRDGRGVVDEPTLLAARSFRWRHGRVRVHVHRRHVGLYGQWMATWRPRNASTAETALLLEDDLTISPFAYRWLRAARRFYADRRDLAGFTLQSEGLIRATDGGPFTPPPVDAGAAYLYALMGSWGFAPRPDVWIGFQDWYAGVTHRLRPVVPGLIMSTWYEKFEREKKADTMWTIWFIYYCSRQTHGQLYTVYNNIHSIADAAMPSSDDRFICINRRESGLHFSGKTPDLTQKLLRKWRPKFAEFIQTPPVFNYGGEQVLVTANNSLTVAGREKLMSDLK